MGGRGMIFLEREKSLKATKGDLIKKASKKKLDDSDKRKLRRINNISKGKPFGTVLLTFDRFFRKGKFRKECKDKYKTRRVVLLGGDGNSVTVVPVYNRGKIVPLSKFSGNRLVNLNQAKRLSMSQVYDVGQKSNDKLTGSEKKEIKRLFVKR